MSGKVKSLDQVLEEIGDRIKLLAEATVARFESTDRAVLEAVMELSGRISELDNRVSELEGQVSELRR